MPQLRAREVQQLLHNKFVVIMGDSIQRLVYKDLVLLLQKDCLLSSSQLKAKGELSFEGDLLLDGGRRGHMHSSIHYREVRQFCSGHHLVRFYFLTRAHSAYVEDVLAQLRWSQYAPDLVVMNSCLWDLARYSHNFRRRYRVDLGRLFRRLDQVLPTSCLLVWNTAMPVAQAVTGSFLRRQAPPCSTRLSEEVMEANFYSTAEAVRHGFDVLDLHFHFRRAAQHRLRDGVHWDQRAHRHLSQLLLAHVADAWGVVLPRRNLVGRWIRDAPAERRPAWTDRRQPQHRRGEPSQQAVSRDPRQSSVQSRSRQDAFLLSQPPLLQLPFYNSSRHQRNCTRETNLHHQQHTRQMNSHQHQCTRVTNSRQRGCSRETNSHQQRGCSRETNSRQQRGCFRETNSRQHRECSRETNSRQHQGCSRETNSHQQRGCSRETNSHQQRGCSRETNSHQQRGCYRETNSRQRRCTIETNFTGCEGRPGPFRRVYTHHQGRGFPYPSRHPSEPQRPHQRHTHQRI